MSNLEGHEAQQQARHFQHKPVQPVLYELVQLTSKRDVWDGWTEEQTISVHSTELGAYKAGLKTSFIVRPLEVKD